LQAGAASWASPERARAEPAGAAATPVAAPKPTKADGRVELDEPETGSVRSAAGRFKGMDRDAVIALVREAVEANRIDLHLQPIVSLPQRKVRYYEALAGLRTRDGELILPADFVPYAEVGGLMARIDNAMLFRCVQAVRRLLIKNREVGLFCNVAAATLVDPEFFPQFAEFADANRAIAPAFVFEFPQSAYRSMGPIASEGLGALAARGFRFSLDHVGDLRLEPRDLADRGFRFVKAPAGLLLNRNAAAAADIDPADLVGLLGRFGIDLIAEKIERESTVVDLLDCDVRLGQGNLFSQPRAVRPDVLQGMEQREIEASALSAAESGEAAADAGEAARARSGPSGPGSAFVRLARGMIARN
jgi:cyclic-di-GMP phosphodiesterase TipF (flagellum assembly factor)